MTLRCDHGVPIAEPCRACADPLRAEGTDSEPPASLPGWLPLALAALAAAALLLRALAG